MTKSIDLLRRELHAFCELAQRRGWRIEPFGGFVDRTNKRCCPMGAVSVVTGKSRAWDRLTGDNSSPDYFGHGFDGHRHESGPMVELGREFRAHYCGEGAP